jgi:hypothetical protein
MFRYNSYHPNIVTFYGADFYADRSSIGPWVCVCVCVCVFVLKSQLSRGCISKHTKALTLTISAPLLIFLKKVLATEFMHLYSLKDISAQCGNNFLIFFSTSPTLCSSTP